MRVNKISCPNCGASINLSIEGISYAFCPYCGGHFAIDDGNRTITRNYNTTLNSDVSYHETYTDDAAIERERRKDHESEREHKETVLLIIVAVLILALCLLIPLFMIFREDNKEKNKTEKALAEGKIQVGQSSDDMEGKDYKVVVEQLRSAGFSDITTIDLDDSGWFTKRGTVESVTISGYSSFSSNDYFLPTAKIVVSYH